MFISSPREVRRAVRLAAQPRLRVRSTSPSSESGNFYVDGRPAVATLTGLDDLFGGNHNLVISGTNRGDNIGDSENISGTVNAAVQGLFEGVPSIAISAASFSGSYDTGFANAASFMVNFLHELQDAQVPGQPLLPTGEGLSINVPGNPNLAGVTVTTLTSEIERLLPLCTQRHTKHLRRRFRAEHVTFRQPDRRGFAVPHKPHHDLADRRQLGDDGSRPGCAGGAARLGDQPQRGDT